VDTYDPRTLERSVAQPPTPTPPTAAAREQQQPEPTARVDATGGAASICDVRALLASLNLEQHWPALSDAGLSATAELRRQHLADEGHRVGWSIFERPRDGLGDLGLDVVRGQVFRCGLGLHHFFFWWRYRCLRAAMAIHSVCVGHLADGAPGARARSRARGAPS